MRALLILVFVAMTASRQAALAQTDDVMARFRTTLETLRAAGDQAAIDAFLAFAAASHPDFADEMSAIAVEAAAADRAETASTDPGGVVATAAAGPGETDEDVRERGLLKNWSGEARAGGAFLTGNTQSRVVTFGLETLKETKRWTIDLASSGRFERRGGESVADRIAGSVDAARRLTDRWRLVGYAGGERDRFSGFDYRATTGVGAEWAVIEGDRINWSLIAGPGVRFDGAEVLSVGPDGMTVEETELRVEPIVRGSSAFDWALTDRISFVQEVDVLAGETSQIDVNSAFDVDLIDRLSLRLGSVIRARPAPPAGAEPVDTESVIELKYEFGG